MRTILVAAIASSALLMVYPGIAPAYGYGTGVDKSGRAKPGQAGGKKILPPNAAPIPAAPGTGGAAAGGGAAPGGGAAAGGAAGTGGAAGAVGTGPAKK